ncbi:hypothetical protein TVAG_438230 [Trichomonas vaginalis G3]|uniref:Uncharacterized protein n=1 Tax=Trichomonas vaginalis (strain ATCC PRA-98 / G3) TaxID=412133 RepID=A2EYM0_TRIV3|nr:bifunctional inhibitor/lipid-transfer protein/seed storage 2s albumin superfamily protein family [Trichomonas vaginalis G3]EAY02233.1 hypothetical protein TVAG_438230 [Trichomonas vaginalis G3]KAI5507298.1 bifunctional inhibitor/lipid-transfer protein/seed storage 2s albumin superfamily protein family [Trichomonas vaginalis G3]|eukprot:XP_001330592.1 hypothetical protein [Trichomonas vaginalis G3]
MNVDSLKLNYVVFSCNVVDAHQTELHIPYKLRQEKGESINNDFSNKVTSTRFVGRGGGAIGFSSDDKKGNLINGAQTYEKRHFETHHCCFYKDTSTYTGQTFGDGAAHEILIDGYTEFISYDDYIYNFNPNELPSQSVSQVVRTWLEDVTSMVFLGNRFNSDPNTIDLCSGKEDKELTYPTSISYSYATISNVGDSTTSNVASPTEYTYVATAITKLPQKTAGSQTKYSSAKLRIDSPTSYFNPSFVSFTIPPATPHSTAHSTPHSTAHSTPHSTFHSTPHSTAFSTAHSTPHSTAHSTPFSTGHSTSHSTFHSTPHSTAHSTPHSTFHSTPHSTPHSTFHSTPHSTAHSTPHSTPHSTAHSTPHSTFHITPFKTAFSTPHSTAFSTAHSTPHSTAHSTAFSTPHSTPHSTAFVTAFSTPHSTAHKTPFDTMSSTPFSTAFETVYSTPFITTHQAPYNTVHRTPDLTAVSISKEELPPTPAATSALKIEGSTTTKKRSIWPIIVGVICGLLLLSLIIFFILFKRRKEDSDTQEISDESLKSASEETKMETYIDTNIMVTTENPIWTHTLEENDPFDLDFEEKECPESFMAQNDHLNYQESKFPTEH